MLSVKVRVCHFGGGGGGGRTEAMDFDGDEDGEKESFFSSSSRLVSDFCRSSEPMNRSILRFLCLGEDEMVFDIDR